MWQFARASQVRSCRAWRSPERGGRQRLCFLQGIEFSWNGPSFLFMEEMWQILKFSTTEYFEKKSETSVFLLPLHFFIWLYSMQYEN